MLTFAALMANEVKTTASYPQDFPDFNKQKPKQNQIHTPKAATTTKQKPKRSKVYTTSIENNIQDPQNWRLRKSDAKILL